MPRRNLRCALAVLAVFILPGVGSGQTPQDEHAKHHAGQQPGMSTSGQPGPTPTAPNAPLSGGSGTGTMGGDMGSMMQQMGAPPPKELYPSLMSLPNMPLEKRAEVERQAHERMTDGTRLLSEALAKLSSSAERDDYAAMQEATDEMRQGLAQFESGLAAHRALAEGKAPRNVALQWFKSEMNLLPPPEVPHGLFGLSWFHYFVMFFLLAFMATMIWMYFHKMRRADLLLASLASGTREISSAPVRPARVAAAGLGEHVHADVSRTVGEAVTPMITTPAGRWSGQLRVTKIFQETRDVRTFRLVHPSGGDLPFTFESGQFLTVSVNLDGKEAKRSYSIASSACRRTWCEITVKHAREGLVSGYLHERLRAGDLLGVSGPFGKFTFRGHEAPSVVLIGGGVGITPLMGAVRCLTDQAWTGEIFLIYACATLQDVIFREELEYLVRRYSNLQLTITLSQEPSPEWTGARGRITKELLTKSVPNLTTRRVHVCGPLPMMEAVKAILAEMGVPPDQVKTENFLGAEPHPAPPGGTPVSVEAVAAVCKFVRSGKTAPLPLDKTVLDVSEDVGVNIEYSCRQGYCGVCKTKLLSGHVTMGIEDALTPEDKAMNILLACQAKSRENIEVDA